MIGRGATPSRKPRGCSPFARKIRLEWNACNDTGFSGVSFRQVRFSSGQKKTIVTNQLHRRMAGKGDEVNRVEPVQDFSGHLEKRNTSEDFHLFRKFSGGMNCTI